MFKSTLAVIGFLAGWLALAAAANSSLLPKPDEVVRIESIKLVGELAPNGKATVEVVAEILGQWHINSDKPSNPDYIPTSLALTVPDHVKVLATQYPVAQLISPAFSAGEVLSVFTGELRVKALLSADLEFKPSGAMPITATIDYQPCNDSQCLRPATVSMTAEVSFGSSAAAPPAETSGWKALSQIQPSQVSKLESLSVFDRYGYALGFLVVFFGGLALNLTPCVYPLIGI